MSEIKRNSIACSMGIMAHNEAANVGRLLKALIEQRTETAKLTEIIVVASGCTDQTESIVQSWAKRDTRIRLVAQACREGKAAAVNCFLAEARERILVLCSADLIPAPDTIEQVVIPFSRPEIGMTTCRQSPVNNPKILMGFAAHLLWDLHHQINLKDFKAGELIAFRRVFERIPCRTAVDDDIIEQTVRSEAYDVHYVATAVVHNKGPETLKDFLSQRRRIYAGHLAIRDALGYTVATISGLRILGIVLRRLDWRPSQFFRTWIVVLLEAYGRFLGWWDYKQRRDHSIWEIAETTKDLASELSAQQQAS
ncbi:MAG: glycosyltransferase [Verrucomicrobiota bacterium]